ncbi:MAG TPA: TIM barrel protein [Candidatus Wallbacteria bacterium]|nr:TIM barrel protein [Candidatus Wallbacteria bacterium]
MKPAISTSLFWKGAFAIDGCFNDIAGAGFKFIELDAHNIFGHLSPGFIEKTVAALQDSGLLIASVHMPYLYPISSPSKSARASAVKSFARTLDSVIVKAERLCLRPLKLIFHPGVSVEKISYAEQKNSLRYGVKEIGNLFANDGRFEIAFENMLSSHFASTADDLKYIAELAKADINIKTGICFDSCHAAYDNLPHEFLSSIYTQVICSHLSDNYNQPDGEFHAIPMSVIHSKIDWKTIMGLLSESAEIFTLELSKPHAISHAAYLKMAKISADELTGFVSGRAGL